MQGSEMRKRVRAMVLVAVSLLGVAVAAPAAAQVDEDQLGAWYMYFWRTQLDNSRLGFQGDGQYRAWNLGSDMEQLLLRGGVTYTPKSGGVIFTLGYANITSGEFGDSDDTSGENRLYQEALLTSQRIGPRVRLTHRFRFEQRWVEDQAFRTRFRYAIFLNIPLTDPELNKGAWYVMLYDELFINGQRDIGDGREVELFDRNRLYGGVGYVLSKQFRLQLGYMIQTTDNISKGQLQFSAHHVF